MTSGASISCIESASRLIQKLIAWSEMESGKEDASELTAIGAGENPALYFLTRTRLKSGGRSVNKAGRRLLVMNLDEAQRQKVADRKSTRLNSSHQIIS